MSTRRYYTVRPDGEPLLPVRDGVMADGVELDGYVSCFPDLEAFLSSATLLMACVGYADEPRVQAPREGEG